jgi:hypothetical protein
MRQILVCEPSLRHALNKVGRNPSVAGGIRVNAIWHGQRFGVVEEVKAIQVINVAVGLRTHGNQFAQNVTDAAQRQLADPFVAAEGLPLNHSVEAHLAWAGVVFVRGAADRRNYKNWRGFVSIANRVDEAVHGRAEGARGVTRVVHNVDAEFQADQLGGHVTDGSRCELF